MDKKTANRIKERRNELGLTQAELAEKLKVTVGYINTIENGKRKVSLKMALRIAVALETHISDIFFK